MIKYCVAGDIQKGDKKVMAFDMCAWCKKKRK